MRNLEAWEIRKIFGGKYNWFTPTVIEVKQIGNLVYELSSGSGIYKTGVFGVTVRDLEGEHVEESPSKLCHSREEADMYIKDLRVQQLLET